MGKRGMFQTFFSVGRRVAAGRCDPATLRSRSDRDPATPGARSGCDPAMLTINVDHPHCVDFTLDQSSKPSHIKILN